MTDRPTARDVLGDLFDDYNAADRVIMALYKGGWDFTRTRDATEVVPECCEAVPPGEYGVWADDDDVIGLTVARTSPRGFFLVRTEPPLMDAFDEFGVGQFLAWCLTNACDLEAIRSTQEDPT